MTEKRVIDWESIERDYRAGILTLREIAGQHSISHVAIQKHASKRAWDRDLSAKILARAEAMVNKAEVTAEVTAARFVNEQQTIEAIGTRIAEIKTRHRTSLKRSQEVAERLLAVLEGMEFDEGGLREITGVLRQLADAQRTLITLESEAWGFANVPEAAPPPPVIDPLEGARRLAFALTRAGQQQQPAVIH